MPTITLEGISLDNGPLVRTKLSDNGLLILKAAIINRLDKETSSGIFTFLSRFKWMNSSDGMNGWLLSCYGHLVATYLMKQLIRELAESHPLLDIVLGEASMDTGTPPKWGHLSNTKHLRPSSAHAQTPQHIGDLHVASDLQYHLRGQFTQKVRHLGSS